MAYSLEISALARSCIFCDLVIAWMSKYSLVTGLYKLSGGSLIQLLVEIERSDSILLTLLKISLRKNN